MNAKTLLPLAILAGLAFWLYRRNKTSAALAPTQVAGVKNVTPAGVINIGGIVPVNTSILPVPAPPIPPNPFLGGNPFLNP